MPSDDADNIGHFARLNALAQRGWLAVLTGSEMALWLAYEKFADRDGVAYPNGETLAEMLGHATDTHVGRVRQRLAKYGLLEVLDDGGGRGRVCKVRLLTPPNRPKGCQNGNLFSEGTGAERLPKRAGKVADPARKGCRSGAPYKEDPPRDPPREQTKGSADKPRGPGPSAKARKLSDEQLAVRDAFTAWFVSEAFPRANEGVEYEFAAEGGRNAKAVLAVLGSKFVAWDLGRAKAVAQEFLREPDEYLARRGHKLYDLAARLSRFAAAAVRRVNGHRAPVAVSARPNGAYERQMAVIDQALAEAED